MALKGLDIFKMTPKTNCKECGSPTCMAFSMKVAQGAVDISKCPHMSAEALATLSEATAPPMKSIKVGTGDAEYTLGGETVLFRHEKTMLANLDSLYASLRIWMQMLCLQQLTKLTMTVSVRECMQRWYSLSIPEMQLLTLRR